jgi:peptidoglycan/xylan/chitin deacetylase (PgdA/CDA1 family)
MRQILKAAMRSTDRWLFSLYLKLYEERSSLLTFLFHEVYSNQKEIELYTKHPQQRLTVEHFRRFIDYYLQNDYSFVSPSDIGHNLAPDRKYILVTFDDGYFNNHLILPILNEYSIPAVFFISTNHVRQNKCFWWDVVYRERAKRAVSDHKIEAEIEMLRSKKHDEIERYIVEEFGAEALTPVGDVDRPMTETELRQLAEQEYVHIGNHTSDHAILTNYRADEIESLITEAQRYLKQVTGHTPETISYPNGGYSEDIIRICRRNGLRIGITVESKKNHLPMNDTDDLLRLGRFILHGNDHIEKQCEFFRSDIALYNRVKTLLAKA